MIRTADRLLPPMHRAENISVFGRDAKPGLDRVRARGLDASHQRDLDVDFDFVEAPVPSRMTR